MRTKELYLLDLSTKKSKPKHIFAKTKIMKKLIALFTIAFVANLANAQEEDYRTIFGNSDNPSSVSGFGAVALDFGSINGDFALMMGGDGAVLFNRSFYVGGYGRGLVTQLTYEYSKFGSLGFREYSEQAAFGHGGLLVGYVFNPTKPFHFGISGKFGMGGIGLYDRNNYNYYDKGTDYISLAPVYVLTPQADFEMNLTNWFKFRASAGYQWVSSESLNYLTQEDGNIIEKELLNSSDFSTPTFSLGFVFGWFK